jgi:hypothetical protein
MHMHMYMYLQCDARRSKAYCHIGQLISPTYAVPFNTDANEHYEQWCGCLGKPDGSRWASF